VQYDLSWTSDYAIAARNSGWAMVKFNFAFLRNTGIEKLRHIVEAIGIETKDDPAYKLKILQPSRFRASWKSLTMRSPFNSSLRLGPAIQRPFAAMQ
jgi:hypothetical protein